MWTEKIIQFADSLFARGVVLIDPTTGDPYTASGGGTGGSGGGLGVVSTLYVCTTSVAGTAKPGEIVQRLQVISSATSITTVWRNLSANTVIGAQDLANYTAWQSTESTLASVLAALQGTLTVDFADNPQPVVDAQAISELAAISGRLPSGLIGNRLAVEPLGALIATTEATATTTAPTAVQFNASAKRVSVRVDATAAAYFAFGASEVDANSRVGAAASRIMIFAGQGDDFLIPTGMTHMTYRRAGSADVAVTIRQLT